MRFRRRSSLWASLCGLLVLWFFSGSAGGDIPPERGQALPEPFLVKDGDSFSVDLTIPGVDLCFVLPVERRDARSCDGIDFATVEKSLQPMVPGQSILAVAYLRYPDWALTTIISGIEETGEIQPAQLKQFTREFLQGLKQAHQGAGGRILDEQAQQAQLSRVNRVQVVRVSVPMKMNGLEGKPLDMFEETRIVLSEPRSYLFLFIADEAHRADAERAIERITLTLKALPSRKTSGSADHDGLAYRCGYHGGPPLLLVLLAAIAWAILRRDWRRQEARRAK